MNFLFFRNKENWKKFNSYFSETKENWRLTKIRKGIPNKSPIPSPTDLTGVTPVGGAEGYTVSVSPRRDALLVSGVWRPASRTWHTLTRTPKNYRVYTRNFVRMCADSMAASSRYSSYNCLTSWDSYDRIPRYAEGFSQRRNKEDYSRYSCKSSKNFFFRKYWICLLIFRKFPIFALIKYVSKMASPKQT